MLSTLHRRFPIFMRDICVTFGTYVPETNDKVISLPSYITPQIIKYCESTNKPNVSEFMGKIPSYFLSNHSENRFRHIIKDENCIKLN